MGVLLGRVLCQHRRSQLGVRRQRPAHQHQRRDCPLPPQMVVRIGPQASIQSAHRARGCPSPPAFRGRWWLGPAPFIRPEPFRLMNAAALRPPADCRRTASLRGPLRSTRSARRCSSCRPRGALPLQPSRHASEHRRPSHSTPHPCAHHRLPPVPFVARQSLPIICKPARKHRDAPACLR